MAERGRRRSSRRVLQVEEVLQSMLKSHPLPEEAVDNGSQSEVSKQPPESMKTTGPPSAKDERPASSNSGWSTQRSSSVSSLDDDEFDQQSSEVIQNLFDDLDAVMYKDKPPSEGNEQMFLECWEWMDKYPHLRVVGEQIHPDEDLGFQALSTKHGSTQVEGSSGNSDDAPAAVRSASRLSIHGKHMDIHTINKDADGSSKMLGDVDEIFEAQGEYEELIAIDCSDDVNDGRLTPSGSELPQLYKCSSPLKESMVDLLSHRIWGEVVTWLQPLLSEYVDHVQRETPKILTHSTAPPILPPSRATRSRLSQLPNMRLATAPPRSLLSDDVRGILSVSSKTLQARQRKYHIPDLPPTPLVHNNVNDEAGVGPDVRTLVRSRRVPASGRLAPLNQAARPSIVDIKEDDWLPVKNIQRPKSAKQVTPPSTGLSSSWGRPITLPPIHHEEQPGFKPLKKQNSNIRASCVPGSSKYRSAAPRRILPFSTDRKSAVSSIITVSLPDNIEPFPSTSSSHAKEMQPDRNIATLSPQDIAVSSPATIDSPVAATSLSTIESPVVASSPANVDSPTTSEDNDGFHTVEPFVSWLLNQVQTNACKAAEMSAVTQAKMKSSTKIE